MHLWNCSLHSCMQNYIVSYFTATHYSSTLRASHNSRAYVYIHHYTQCILHLYIPGIMQINISQNDTAQQRLNPDHQDHLGRSCLKSEELSEIVSNWNSLPWSKWKPASFPVTSQEACLMWKEFLACTRFTVPLIQFNATLIYEMSRFVWNMQRSCLIITECHANDACNEWIIQSM
jgi:hypothetical protein